MKSIEKEIKQLLTINEYNTLRDAFGNFAECEEIVQINYYFDDNAYSLYNRGDTLRVRQKQNVLKLERKFNKCYLPDGVRISEEYSKSIDNLPMKIVVDGNEYFYIGNLVTVRRNYKIDDSTISLDANYYLGEIDYELEIEFCKVIDVPEFVRDKLRLESKSEGKYTRFMKKRKHNKYNVYCNKTSYITRNIDNENK